MKPIYTLDLETDPFEHNVVVKPFVSGFYDGKNFTSIWDEKRCIDRTVEMLASVEPGVIYAHNGGKFDFFYFLPHFTGPLTIISGRIVKAQLGHHEFRDSYAIMPFPLSAYKKDDFDYETLRAAVRGNHRDTIIRYLRGDCVYLHDLCTTFYSEFGDRLTIGGSSLKQLKKYHKFTSVGAKFDSAIRKDFYYGGRVECFQKGLVKQKCEIIDVNSMYPYVMRDYRHPVGGVMSLSKRIESDTCFVVATGANFGAFPVRSKTGGLDFSTTYGTYSTTIHEFQAALETGAFRCDKIKVTYGFTDRITFEEYINHFYDQRKIAKKNGDSARDLLYKYTLNSSYGKFAQNPANYYDWQITDANTILTDKCEHCKGTQLCSPHCANCALIRDGKQDISCAFCDGTGFRWAIDQENGSYTIWSARVLEHRFYNVATGASITGAARAVLLRGLHKAIKPVYCDTDSITAESTAVIKDADQLGAWKLEGTGDCAAIAGKKLYAIFSQTEPPPDKRGNKAERVSIDRTPHWCIKKAHKGARLTAADILSVAQGGEVHYKNPVPAYKLSGKHVWVSRTIRATV